MRYFGVTKVPNDKFQHTFQIELFDSYIFYSLVINNQDHEHASDDDDVIRERMRSCMWNKVEEHMQLIQHADKTYQQIEGC